MMENAIFPYFGWARAGVVVDVVTIRPCADPTGGEARFLYVGMEGAVLAVQTEELVEHSGSRQAAHEVHVRGIGEVPAVPGRLAGAFEAPEVVYLEETEHRRNNAFGQCLECVLGPAYCSDHRCLCGSCGLRVCTRVHT